MSTSKRNLKLIEITGQPCAGKSSLVKKTMLPSGDFIVFKPNIHQKVMHFIFGCSYLGIARTRTLLAWSFLESCPVIFKCNIFFNAVSKFGCRKILEATNSQSASVLIIDEGISHLPFLFLNTDTSLVMTFISAELKDMDVQIIVAPGKQVIYERLKKRGHKRLKYIPINIFMARNYEVEATILSHYPTCCQTLKTV
jgi:hypothetical protein